LSVAAARRPQILVTEPDAFPADGLEVLSRVGDVSARSVSRAELAEAFCCYDAILVRLAHRIDTDILGLAPRCRILGTPTTGLDHIDLAACASRGVQVISLRQEKQFLRTVRGTAEHSVALALALLRGIVPAVAAVNRGEWDRDAFRGHEIHGMTVGVLGVGRIGSMVADSYLSMKARVLGYDARRGWRHKGVARCRDIHTLCDSSDLLTVHVSYDVGDPPAVSASVISRLPRGAFLVNTSRGGAVDEAAILEALRSGQLGGVAADVLMGEPDVRANPLIEYARQGGNVIITPHIGGNTLESRVRAETLIAQRVEAALRSLE